MGVSLQSRQIIDHDGSWDAERVLRDVGLPERFVETVEALVGRRNRSFISGVDVETETNVELRIKDGKDDRPAR